MKMGDLMKKYLLAFACVGLIFAGLVYGQAVALIPFVHKAAMAGEFTAARQALDVFRKATGVTPEYIEAFSWLGRGQLNARNSEAAWANVAEVRKLAEEALLKRKLDAEPHLPIALGAAIEVQAQLLGAANRRDEAVLFLRDEIKRWQGSSIIMRLQKNVNLLTLEGKPVPEIVVKESVGSVKPKPLSAHRGRPVLVFLWAHWCGDCKNEVAIVGRLMKAYGPKGLEIVAPTQRYGYVAGGLDAAPATELKYINEVFSTFYAPLAKVEAPLSEENFRRFGVSTTPTLLLVDAAGIVRLYNPGAMTYEALAARIEPLLMAAK